MVHDANISQRPDYLRDNTLATSDDLTLRSKVVPAAGLAPATLGLRGRAADVRRLRERFASDFKAWRSSGKRIRRGPGEYAPVAVNFAVSPASPDMPRRLGVRAASLALGTAGGACGQPRAGTSADELSGLVARNPAAARSRNGRKTAPHRHCSGCTF